MVRWWCGGEDGAVGGVVRADGRWESVCHRAGGVVDEGVARVDAAMVGGREQWWPVMPHWAARSTDTVSP